MWEPRRLKTLWASTACYSDNFTFTFAECSVREQGSDFISEGYHVIASGKIELYISNLLNTGAAPSWQSAAIPRWITYMGCLVILSEIILVV
jgi:hypothetical protein